MAPGKSFSRREFLKLASATAAGAVLAACGAPSGGSPSGDGPVVLDYWFCWSGRYADIQRENVLDMFDEEFEGKIQINDLPVPSNIRQKMVTAVAAGESPDAAACFGDLVSLAAQGAFLNIDSYVEASDVIEIDEVYEARLGACKWNGALYGFPYNCSAELLLFNVGLFEEAGIDYKKPFETWAEFAEVSKQLVSFSDGGDLETAAFVNWYPRHPALWFWCNGGDAYDPEADKITIDMPENVEGLQAVIDYAWDVYGDIAKADDFISGAGGAQEGPFCIGKMAVDYVGDWMPSTYHEWCPDIKIWPSLFPKGPSGDAMVASNAGDFVGVLKGTDTPDEAYVFAEWMLMKGNIGWTKAGVDTNCLKRDAGVLRDDWVDIFGDEDTAKEMSKWWALQMQESKAVENFPAYGFMVDELRRVFDLAFHQQSTAAEALAEAQANVDAEMDKYRVP